MLDFDSKIQKFEIIKNKKFVFINTNTKGPKKRMLYVSHFTLHTSYGMMKHETMKPIPTVKYVCDATVSVAVVRCGGAVTKGANPVAGAGEVSEDQILL